MSEPDSLRLGISACLLGDQVRFDGGHKRDPYLTDTLGRWVEWVRVCPEMGAGMGTPRETLRLVGTPAAPRLVSHKSQTDWTEAMRVFAHQELERLAGLDLSGFVLKSKSPSCGMERVRVYGGKGMPSKNGVGLFAAALMARFPLLPVEEEGRLHDPVLREAFVEQVFAYRRWQTAVRTGLSRGALVRFHTAHKYLLMAHSPKGYAALGRLVGEAKQQGLGTLRDAYGTLFMQSLKARATVRKHCNVLQHLAGYFKKSLDAAARQELAEVIDDYRRGLVPLVVPITLLRHHVRAQGVDYLAQQVYLLPTPKELMIRNHV